MKRVLVTGASGFIGRAVLPELAARDYEIHAVSRSRSIPEAERTTWHAADLLAPGQAARLIETVRPTHLVHLAWVTEHGAYWTSPENLDWVQASLQLVRAFAANGGARAVLAGTCAEYDWRFGFCREGVTPLAPQTLYGVCKHALASVVEAFAAAQGLSAAWCRF